MCLGLYCIDEYELEQAVCMVLLFCIMQVLVMMCNLFLSSRYDHYIYSFCSSSKLVDSVIVFVCEYLPGGANPLRHAEKTQNCLSVLIIPAPVVLVDSVIVAGCECLPGEGRSKKQYAVRSCCEN